MAFTDSRRRFLRQSAQGLGLAVLAGRLTPASAADASTASEMTDKAVAFLKSRQDGQGGWSTDRKEPGITALVTTALLRSKRVAPADPSITRAISYLERFIGPKGGLSEAAHANYSTSIALVAFHEANVNGRYDRVIKAAQEFLKSMQWDEAEGKDRENPFYGGAGYGGKNSRPDLSNTSFMMEALRDTGVPADDPNLQKALVFVSRCQNLKSEFNDQAWAGKINDGGFVYTAANAGESMAGKTADGGLRSYGSMTYAGFKSLIYAGLTPDDPRVKAALEYIKAHYSVDENPGMGEKGLYYYYQAFAKSMSVLGRATFVDASGRSHDWRAELTAALAKRQNRDGSWVNSADRFMEGDPNLVTAYALLALSYCRANA